MKNHFFRLAILALSFSLIFTGLALAQQAVGVVTALRGKAQLTRATTKTALSFKDDLNLRDVIDTQEKSLIRVLFGGKSTVTMRELSRLEVREELIPGGTTRTVYELSSGSILVNVARSLMRKGDEVQIRTPNAVARVTGSTILVQYNAALAQTIFILLTGSAIATPQGQPPITLTPNTSVNVTGTAATGVQVGPVGTVTQAEATEIVDASEVEAAVTEEANQEQTAKVQTEQAAELATAIVEAVTGETLAALQDTQQEAQETVQEVETAGTEQTVETIAQSPPQTAIEQGFTPVVEAASEEPAPSSGGGTVSETLESESVQIAILEGGGILPSSLASTLPFIFGSDTTSSRSSFFQLSNETLNVSDNLILVKSGVNVNLTGKLLSDIGSTFNIGSRFLRLRDGATLTSTTTSPLITLSGSTVDAERTFVSLSSSTSSGSTLTLSGPLLDATNSSSITTGDPDLNRRSLLFVGNSSTLSSSGSDPLITFNQSTLNTSGAFLSLRRSGATPSTVSLAGPLLKATNSTFKSFSNFQVTTSCCSFLFLAETGKLESSGTTALFQLTDSTFDIGGNLVSLREVGTVNPGTPGPATLTLKGPLLTDSGSTFTIARNFLRVRDSSSLSSTTTSPLITLSGSTLKTNTLVTAASSSTRFLDLRLSGKLTLGGPFLKATSSTFTTNADFARVTQLATLTGTGTTALFQFTNSTFNIGSDTVESDGGEPGDNFFRVDDSSGSTVTGAATVTLAGPLVSDSGSTFTIADDFLRVIDGSTLTSTTTSPLITLSGSTVNVSDDLFDVEGQSITDQPIKGSQSSFTVNSKTASNPIGALFKATNAANITVKSAVELDNALFEATLPVVELVGSSTTQTKITASDTFADIGRSNASKVLLKGPFIALDNSLIKVTTGPLLSLKNGSTMDVSGDLLKLISGSTINVVNGPLIKVDGSGSALDVTGALVNFGGTGGNTIIVRNGLCSGTCATKGASSINVLEQTSGTITISGTDIKNLSFGSIDVGSTDAVIQVRNSGTVTIQGN